MNDIFQVVIDGKTALTGSWAEMRAAAMRIGTKARVTRWHGTEATPRPQAPKSATYDFPRPANVPDSVRMSDPGIPRSKRTPEQQARVDANGILPPLVRKPTEPEYTTQYEDNGLVIERAYSQYSTHYRLTGSLERINEHVSHLMREFHPAGYGTSVKTLTSVENGLYQAVVYRSNSCD